MLAREVDGASLALFRICFGVVMFAHAVKYLYPQHGTSLKAYLYDSTSFNFTYPGLSWVQPLPEPWWTGMFVLMGVAALGVALGVAYRISAATLFLSYTYIFLSEAAKYNNHYYLMCLFAFLLLLTPADRRFSISAWRRKNTGSLGTTNAPFWAIFILRAQLFVVYFFGGIAKLNYDWLTGVPMIGKGREVLAYWTPILNLPQIEPIYMGLFIAWFGLVFDLSIGFLLIARRTRLFAFTLTAGFHVGNHFLFPIGLFPIMALTTTLIFCEADWPVRLWSWLRKPTVRRPDRAWSLGGLGFFPPLGVLLGWSDRRSGMSTDSSSVSRGVMTLLACFFLLQVSVPFRHLLIKGDANWTEEGQDFSWRMMLRAKDASHVIYHVVDDEMLVKDARGNSRVHWSRAPQGSNKYLFVPVDSEKFEWSHHPGLTMTFEPALGLRAVYRLSPDEDLAKLKSALQNQWKTMTNHEVPVRETLGWAQILRELDGVSERANMIESVASSIENLRASIMDAKKSNGFAREQVLANLAEEVEFLMAHDDASEVHSILRRLQPFALQSSNLTEAQFLIVEDEEFAACGTIPDGLSAGSELLVWIDIARLRPADWERLPNWFVTFENRQIKILWNYAEELNSIQKRRFSTSPWMIRQYSMAIADRWQKQTTRRPEVYVTSNIMLNYRVPQSLVDPSVDLASSSYSVLKHNDWILPLSQDVGDGLRTATPRATGNAGAKLR